MEKECKKHGLTDHVFREGENRYRCRKCAVEAVQKRRNNVKEMAVAYKGGKCENILCGYNKYVGALEFHHIDSNEKDFEISRKGYTRSWEKTKEELDKCVMLCSNCHKEVHAGLLDVSYLDIDKHAKIDVKILGTFCIDCGKEIDRYATRCKDCFAQSKRKVDRPPLNIIISEIETLGYTEMGKKYGVNGNSIRKWIKYKN